MVVVDLVVKNGLIVFPEYTVRGAIAIDEGKIVAIGSGETMPNAERVIDAEGLYVLPGIIDAHVHFREPGLEYKEDFYTGSIAAVCGGVTAVCDMPNVNPPTKDRESFMLKLEKAKSKSLVDFGIFGVVLPDNIDRIQELRDAGVVGYKIFMGETVGRLASPDDWELVIAFRKIAETGLRVGVHAENRAITDHLVNEFKRSGKMQPIYHLESRPSISEAEATQRAILFSSISRTKLHIFHLSSREGVEIIRETKTRGLPVTAETCPHYLLLDGEKALKELGPVVKMNPPVRSLEHAEALWRGLKEGVIDMIASDHSPHTPEEKFKDNIWEAIAGWPGVETMLPLILNEVGRGRITINDVVKYMSEGPAKVWGFYPKKGALRIGSDGDLTIVDLREEYTIKAEELHSKNKFTPFDGWKVKGKPIYTIIRGAVVYEKGQINLEHRGQLITPL
jgi:allantoinase